MIFIIIIVRTFLLTIIVSIMKDNTDNNGNSDDHYCYYYCHLCFPTTIDNTITCNGHNDNGNNHNAENINNQKAGREQKSLYSKSTLYNAKITDISCHFAETRRRGKSSSRKANHQAFVLSPLTVRPSPLAFSNSCNLAVNINQEDNK